MRDANPNGCVTYRALLTASFSTLFAACSIGWGAWQVHVAQPHVGAATHRELDIQINSLAIRINDLNSDLNRVERKIDKVAELLENR